VALAFFVYRFAVSVPSVGQALCVLTPWMVHGNSSVLGGAIPCADFCSNTRQNYVEGTKLATGKRETWHTRAASTSSIKVEKIQNNSANS
jgi:hypothetical protein